MGKGRVEEGGGRWWCAHGGEERTADRWMESERQEEKEGDREREREERACE